MDDVLRRKAVAAGDLRLAGRATLQRTAFGQQFRPGGAVNRPVHAAAAEQGFVGRVDDGIDRQPGDIALGEFQAFRMVPVIVASKVV